MPDQTIVCPECGYEFPLSEAITHQIEENVRKEFDAKSKLEREKIETRARKAAEEASRLELTEIRSQFEEIQRKLKESQAIELELRKKERELEEGKAALELEVARRVDAEFEKINAEHAKRETVLIANEKKLEEAKRQLEDQVAQRLKSEREKIEIEAKIKADEASLLELKDLRSQNDQMTSQLKLAQKMELELRQSKRELEAREEGLKLEVARIIDEERNIIRDEAIRQMKEEHLFKDKEKTRQLDGLRQQIDELRRKAEQGS